MAKRKEIITEENLEKIDVVDAVIEAPKKPKVDVTYYPLKKRLKTSNGWKEIGDKIGLTKDAYRDFKFKKIV